VPAPREGGEEVAGYRVRELKAARKPSPSLETRGGSGAYPTGGQSCCSLMPGPGTHNYMGARPKSGDMWWLRSLPRREAEVVESVMSSWLLKLFQQENIIKNMTNWVEI
jgi:hypothetical protein